MAPASPKPSNRIAGMRGNVFGVFQQQMEDLRRRGELIPFHIGDSILLPPEAARHFDEGVTPGGWAYGPTGGMAELRAAFVRRLPRLIRHESPSSHSLLVTPGATGGLSCLIPCIASPGEEILVLAPYWPLIDGICTFAAVKTIEIPVGPLGAPDDMSALLERLNTAVTPRTRAIYFSNPNNPAGYLLDQGAIQQLVDWSRARGLWLISDEAYAAMVFDGLHAPALGAEGGLDHVCAVITMSKLCAMSGARIGAALVPRALENDMIKALTHTTFHASVPSQHMALRALDDLDGWLPQAAAATREARDQAARGVHAPFFQPPAGAYLFLDLRKWCGPDGDVIPALRRLLDQGVCLTPGHIFGRGYEGFARLCYTSVTPTQLREGVRRLNQVLGV